MVNVSLIRYPIYSIFKQLLCVNTSGDKQHSHARKKKHNTHKAGKRQQKKHHSKLNFVT